MELIHRLIMVILDVVVIAYPGECANWMKEDLPYKPLTNMVLLEPQKEECWLYYRATEIPVRYSNISPVQEGITEP